uniref:Uncharacterized protein n=1 Tax=Arundo donax TaxID=35708 RepID=A0A0A9FQF1_ARUDO
MLDIHMPSYQSSFSYSCSSFTVISNSNSDQNDHALRFPFYTIGWLLRRDDKDYSRFVVLFFGGA